MKPMEAMEALLEDGADAERQSEAMQVLIDDGSVWSMEGSMGRAAMGMIEQGLCCLGPESRRDYWGNRLPARGEVQDGTKGSLSFANARRAEMGLPPVREAA